MEEKEKKIMVSDVKVGVPDIVMDMAKVAVEKADVGILEKLVEMRRQLKDEWAKERFFEALSAFQAELKPVKKTKAVKNKDGTIRYHYATFDDIVSAIQPLLEKYGLSYHFKTSFDAKSVTVDCIVTHREGHSETTSFKAPIEFSGRMLPIQEWGSALTYSKRYSLSLALGLATEEDTDMVVEEHPVEKLPEKPPEQTFIRQEQKPKIIKPVIEIEKDEEQRLSPEASSAYAEQIIKHLATYKNIFQLRNGWKKHYEEWKAKLQPEDFAEVVRFKDDLKVKLTEDAEYGDKDDDR